MNPLKIVVAAVSLTVCLLGSALADTIVLKNGDRLTTRKAWVENGQVKFYLGAIESSYKQEDVLEVIPEGKQGKMPTPPPRSEPVGEYRAPAAENPARQIAGQPSKPSGKTATGENKLARRAALKQTHSAETIVAALNQVYGNVCRAELSGWFTLTLKLDWTARTNKLTAASVLSKIGEYKQDLRSGGVRYLQVPNDAGTYNVFDWETGGKTSIKDRAPYYFE